MRVTGGAHSFAPQLLVQLALTTVPMMNLGTSRHRITIRGWGITKAEPPCRVVMAARGIGTELDQSLYELAADHQLQHGDAVHYFPELVHGFAVQYLQKSVGPRYRFPQGLGDVFDS